MTRYGAVGTVCWLPACPIFFFSLSPLYVSIVFWAAPGFLFRVSAFAAGATDRTVGNRAQYEEAVPQLRGGPSINKPSPGSCPG